MGSACNDAAVQILYGAKIPPLKCASGGLEIYYIPSSIL